jgi:PKD domain-containing protein/PEGA domain-containing protein
LSDQVSAGRRPMRTKATAGVLSALLASGYPGMAVAGEPGEAAAPPATLSVATEPAGATVYVDGESRGAAPVELKHLMPGDHRLRVVKPGYLENSRVLTVRAGRPQAVAVKLTPDANAVRHTQVETPPAGQEEKKGGGKKMALIALGVAAVGAGAYLALRETNKAPVAGTVSLSPNETALEGATNVTFSAQGASDPDGDALTYNWNFGDNGTGTGQSSSHTYAAAGSYNVQVTVSDGKLSATSSGTANVRDLSGAWGGTITGGFGVIPFTVNLAHSNTTVSGNFTAFDDAGVVTGSVSSQKSVRLTVTIPEFEPFTMTGNADASIDRVTGTVTGSGFVGEQVVLTRR